MRVKSNNASTTSHFSEKEDLTTYLSSKQVWDVLVHLLYLTAKPLFEQTTMRHDIIFSILSNSTDFRRRVTIASVDDCMNYSYRLFFADSDTCLRSILGVLGVERNLFHTYIDGYLEGVYTPTFVKTDSGFDEESLKQYVRDFYEVYCDFRQKIANRFFRIANSAAGKHHWQRKKFGLNSELEDTEQIYNMSILRALDKFYPGNGTLAGYLIPWLNNASSSPMIMYLGEAYNITRPVRSQVFKGKLDLNNKSYSLEDALEVPDVYRHEDSSESYLKLLGKLQQASDTTFVFLLNKFPQVFIDSNFLRIRLEELSDTDLTDWQPPRVELEDLPIVSPLSRASRRDSSAAQRRKSYMGKPS